MTRPDGRRADELRPIEVIRGYVEFAEGSVLYSCGKTRVLVNASVDERVPDFIKGKGRGWVTAEYSMLPRSTETRSPREVSKGRLGGRTHEIQRLIGRSLRAVCDMKALGERTIWFDCDVIQADGGTRTASITAAFIAFSDAVTKLVSAGTLKASPIIEEVAAVSVGIVKGEPVLDLDYIEDSSAEVDMNLVMTGSGRFIEVQGTAEGEPFTQDQLTAMLDLGRKGLDDLIAQQRRVLGI